MTLEVACYNIEGALTALEGGADRVELCADRASGGTTPAYGVTEVVRKNLSIDLFVMIRPRSGDFCYSRYEIHAMKRDIAQFQRLGVDGFVLGILNRDGRLDVSLCREMIERIRPLKVTCHRAFDLTPDPFEALEQCVEAGFDRILTSGQKQNALEGSETIAKMRERSEGRIRIMAGAGIRPDNVQRIISRTGVDEIHFSASTTRESDITYRASALESLGADADGIYTWQTADAGIIRSIRAASR